MDNRRNSVTAMHLSLVSTMPFIPPQLVEEILAALPLIRGVSQTALISQDSSPVTA